LLAVSDRVYLDASAVVAHALGLAGSPDPRNQNGHAGLEALIAGEDDLVGSPITLAEFSSVMYTKLRDGQGWLASFDNEAVLAAETRLMGWLASGRLRIRHLGPRAFEMGMAYVAAASREHGRKMKAWDAIHLYEACRWSRENGDVQITLATGDSDFNNFCTVFPEFQKHVRIIDTTA
jgi:predicted nucleic acid-binding protein